MTGSTAFNISLLIVTTPIDIKTVFDACYKASVSSFFNLHPSIDLNLFYSLSSYEVSY